MPLARSLVYRGTVSPNRIAPGDLLASGKQFAAPLTAAANGVILGSAIAAGMLRRTGPTAAFTDTTDSSTNIMTALKGNAYAADDYAGISFDFQYINTVAFAQTLAAGAGVVLGVRGGSLNALASSSIMYMFTIRADMNPLVVNANLTNGSVTALFSLPPNALSLPIGPSPQSINIPAGATIVGTNIAVGATVLASILGQGGIIGVQMSAAATATISTPLTFISTLEVNALGL